MKAAHYNSADPVWSSVAWQCLLCIDDWEGSGLGWEAISHHYQTIINQSLVRAGDCHAWRRRVWALKELRLLRIYACWWGEAMNLRTPSYMHGLNPERGPKSPDLDSSQHPSCESFCDLHDLHHERSSYPTPLHSSPCVFGCSPELPTLCLVRECTQGNKSLQDRKARRSLPSVGMKFRGPGSSGNARLVVRRIQHIRNKEWEIPAAIATQLRILGTNTKIN